MKRSNAKKHKHNHCAHEHLDYCTHCDVAYCLDCDREWGRERVKHVFNQPLIRYEDSVDKTWRPIPSIPQNDGTGGNRSPLRDIEIICHSQSHGAPV